MTQQGTLVNPNEIYETIKANSPETIGGASIEMSFDEMEVDSLSLVEFAVVLSEKYGIFLQDWQLAEAGNFTGTADIVNNLLSQKNLS
ncbi:phosphopantetheine-binding protein [Glutamicibacter mishrai]|uniref:acyl carrier protein n=1 Tax=Glutamicibacter mishrai TaxID=1775880 RepID=UPI0020CC91DB|nr:acyl carrier protein [Glutamicibacter mishrai]UTT40445.1 phosphopantetheine-binding protein [Glutamicibacter mishrai]